MIIVLGHIRCIPEDIRWGECVRARKRERLCTQLSPGRGEEKERGGCVHDPNGSYHKSHPDDP